MKRHFLSALMLLFGCRAALAQCTADAGPSQSLTCTISNVQLQGSSNIPGATYAWSGPNGFASTQQTPTVLDPGMYTLTITDPSDGCTATATVAVTEDTAEPGASAAASGTLTCVTTQVALVGSSPTSGVVFEWSGPNGYGSNQQNPLTNQPGVYTVTVTNTTNGCTSTAAAVVMQDIVAPDVTVTGGTLTCANPTVTITATSFTSNVTYVWIGPSGFASTIQNPMVSAPGTYIVTVTSMNGCTSTAVAAVTQDAPFVIQSTASPVTCNGGSNGSILPTVTGGTPPFLFLWSTGATTQPINDLPAGTYMLTVIDANGCTNVATVVMTQPAAIQIAAALSTITHVICFGNSNGSISLPNPTGGTPPYLYSWSGPNGFTSNTRNISGLTAGQYTLIVTDSNGCSRQFSYQVSGPAAQLSITNTLVCEGTLSVTPAGGVSPYIYIWSNGDWNPVANNLQPGTYTVIVTDQNGCTITQTLVLTANAPPCTRIIGKLTFDENQNCLADAPDPALKNRIVRAEGANGTYYGMSDFAGNYVVPVVPGDYVVSLPNLGPNTSVCDDDQPVTLAPAGDVDTVDFLVQFASPDCPHLSVDLSTPLLRRCFSNNYYYVRYCNDGPTAVQDVYVTLELDPFLIFLQAPKPHIPLGNNTFRFNLGTVPAGFCDQFWVRVQVSCDAFLGQTHCSEARIYPDTICDPINPLWSGAQVEVKSECAGDSLRFILRNIGTGGMSQPLEYIVIEDGIMLRSGNAPALPAGGEMAVTVPANGATWRVEAQQEPLSPRPDPPVLSVEGCTSTGSFSTGFVNQFALGDANGQLDINCTPNIGSYDPNDKQGFPVGYGPSHYVRPGTEIEYLIRFQNTGTDTAFTVVIRDTLAPWLDPLTVRPGASSHDYRFELTGPGILIFDYQNILLPDSNVNEPASHGFVQFRVRPRADVPLETDILNSAAIYFDFNDPIITNTTVHRIGENFVTVRAWSPALPKYAVQVAPHPVSEAAWVRLSGAPETGHYRLRLFDAGGRLAREMTADAPQFLLHKAALRAGAYFFLVERNGAPIGNGTLVVE